MSAEYNNLASLAHRAADVSGQAILPYFRSELAIDNKAATDKFDPVTEGDRAGERAIRELISQAAPEHGLVGEEFDDIQSKGPYRWIIDPIDGTRAFLLGLPTWGTLIGLEKDGEPILGVMNQPFVGERFWSDGSQSFNRTASGARHVLKTRTTVASLKDAHIAASHPDMFHEAAEAEGFNRLKHATRDSRFGTDCYAYCLLAAGHIDIVVEAGLQPYDIVALIPIIKCAGGHVTDWNGNSASAGGRVIASANAQLHEQALQVLAGK